MTRALLRAALGVVLTLTAACADTGASASDDAGSDRPGRDGAGSVCGDGIVEGAEECDDQNRSAADGCADCRLVHAFACESCTTNADCGVFGTCVDLVDGRWCATSCAEAPCPGGYACRERAGELLCEPIDSRCRPCPDDDGDRVCDEDDVCPDGDDAVDADQDGTPDACDSCPLDPGGDSDGDGVCDSEDVCTGGDDRVDSDGDGVADGCDACPSDNPDDTDDDGVCDSDDVCAGGDDDADTDGDGIADACDPCDDRADEDADGVCDELDPCPLDNPDDTDGDGTCDSEDPCPLDSPDDSDSDGVCDSDDACPGEDDREDADDDGIPDACDDCEGESDIDRDGICDSADPCPLDNPDDSDRDGVCDSADPCPFDNPDDSDGDGVCDADDVCAGGDDATDRDRDGAPDDCDACPDSNPDDADMDEVCDDVDVCLGGDDRLDTDRDGTPDDCDACSTAANDDDADGDGVCDDDDVCPGGDDDVDSDGDGTPDDCELDPGVYAYDRVPLGGIGNLSHVAIAPSADVALIADRRDTVWVVERQSERFRSIDLTAAGDDGVYWVDIAFAPGGDHALLLGNRWDDGRYVGLRLVRFDVAAWRDGAELETAFVELEPTARRELGEALAYHPGTGDPVILSRTESPGYIAYLDAVDPADGAMTLLFAEATGAGCNDVAYARNELGGDGWLVVCGTNGADVLFYKEIGGVWELVRPDTGSTGNMSRAFSHPSGDYALIVGWSADAIFRFERGSWTRLADYSRRRLWNGAFQPSGRRALVVGEYQSIFGDEFGGVFEVRDGFDSCPTVLTPECDVREVSIPFFGDAPYLAVSGFVLNDVAWWPDCDGGFIVAGRSNFSGDSGLLIEFQRELGRSCDLPSTGG